MKVTVFVCKNNKSNFFSELCQYKLKKDPPCVLIPYFESDIPKFCPFNEDEPEADWKEINLAEYFENIPPEDKELIMSKMKAASDG